MEPSKELAIRIKDLIRMFPNLVGFYFTTEELVLWNFSKDVRRLPPNDKVN